ncbi:MAG: 2-phosphosulfolactate phosphatase [Bacteroidales bacterium]|nr:2-phosphosulfolactate phosphatase [Bacteroidales bacterium]
MNHTIEVVLSPALFDYRQTLSPFDAVAVDVLRATTSMCAAFQAGADCIIPVMQLDELANYRKQGFLTAAERSGQKVEGATYGNSPTAFLKDDLRGMRIAYSTTNGTRCLLRAAQVAERTYAGAFSNIDTLCQKLLEHPRNLIIVCSGWKLNPCMEDSLMAGCLSQKILEHGDYDMIEDGVRLCIDLWERAKEDPYGYCQRAAHVQRLRHLGYEQDILFAFESNSCPVVPMLEDGILRITKNI